MRDMIRHPIELPRSYSYCLQLPYLRSVRGQRVQPANDHVHSPNRSSQLEGVARRDRIGTEAGRVSWWRSIA